MSKINQQTTIDPRQAHPPAQAGPLPSHDAVYDVFCYLVELGLEARQEAKTAVYGRIAKEGGGSHER